MTKAQIETERTNAMASFEQSEPPAQQYEIEQRRIDYLYPCRLESFERDTAARRR